MKAIAIIIPVLCSMAMADGQLAQNEKTTPPIAARFEIIQSSLSEKCTYLFDRYTGHISIQVAGTSGTLSWQDQPVTDLPPIANPTDPQTPRFQMFISGLTARDAYLLDTQTGKTWLSATDANGAGSWQPIREQSN
jgi:hypothetical protein